MNKKRAYIIYAVLAMAVIPLGAMAKGKKESAAIRIEQKSFLRQGDEVTVKMNITIAGAGIRARQFVALNPVISADDNSLYLPPVMINGRNRQKVYRRLVNLRKDDKSVGMVIDAGTRDASGTYTYTHTVPFQEWMDGAQLFVYEEQCDCNGPIVAVVNTGGTAGPAEGKPAQAGSVRPAMARFIPSFVKPEPESAKMRSEKYKAYLTFPVDISMIRPEFGDNAAELQRIRDIVEHVRANPDYDIQGFSIDGYASPEAPLDHNIPLSQNRAAALKNYIRERYDYPEGAFTVRGHGEDWDGLEALLADYEMPHKREVLNIISSTQSLDGREKKFKELAGGVPYRMMLQDLFPQLRRLEFTANYEVRPISSERGREVIKTAPGSMSMDEMFLVAQLYEAGSPEFNDVFETIARIYPGSDIANMNAAASALARNDTVLADRYLGLVKVQDAGYFNNMGILAYLTGDESMAQTYFRRAAEAGSAEASANLKALENR